MNDNDIQILTDLFTEATGHCPDNIVMMPGAGSNRKYYRLLVGRNSLVGVSGTNVRENEAFMYLSGHFREKGLHVPKVHAVSADKLYYLQDDLGDSQLFNCIKSGRESGIWDENGIGLLRKTIEELPKLQWEGAKGLDFTKCYPIHAMDRKSVMWDLNYFKYCFLKTTGLEFDELRLEKDFETLATMLLHNPTPTFMYRDFQSRNVMLDDEGSPWFIDFQGGRRGPCHYDVASFLWQAKARIPHWLREELIDCYIDASLPFCSHNPEQFRKDLRLFVLFRTLQVLGAYGFRGYFERKPHFIQSIPDAIRNLRDTIKGGFKGLPYLSQIITEMVQLEKFNTDSSTDQKDGGLTVAVNSFGFRKSGIPNDPSGNGGGFVFDCRALHNPGRYEEYKQFTGIDRKVADFIESDESSKEFLGHAFSLVDKSVECYLQRGFTDLSVSFGCTGGQHRSVYCAEQMAQHLHEKYGCRIRLSHIEQKIFKTLEPKAL